MTFSGCLSINGRVPVRFLHFSDDGSMLVSLTEFVDLAFQKSAHMLQVWDVETGSELFSTYIRHIRYMGEAVVYFSPNNDYLILPNLYREYNKTCIFDWRNDEIVTNFSETFHDWSDDGKYLAMENSDHNIEIWNATSFEVVKEVNVTITRGQKMSFSPDGSELAFVKYNEKCLYLYNVSTGTIRQLDNSSIRFKNIFPNCLYILQWSDDGKNIAVTYDKSGIYGWIIVWNLSDGSILKDKKIKTLAAPILSVDFKKYGFITSDKSSQIYSRVLYVNDTLTDTEIFSVDFIELTDYHFLILDWSNLSNYIAIGGKDGVITIFDGDTGAVVDTLKTPVFSMSPGT